MTSSRLVAAAATALAIGATLPSAAAATDYCVAPSDGCVGTKAGSIEQALDLADDATNPDRVILGAAVYTPQSVAGFQYFNENAPVEIVGQGRGNTVLTGGAGSVLEVHGGPGTSIHDLTIRLPEDAATATTGLRTSNTARRIQVIEPPFQSHDFRRGVWLVDGGTLEDSTVDIGTVQDTTGVLLGNSGVFGSGGNTVRDSVVSARTGIAARHGATIERSRITGTLYGIRSSGELTRVSSSLVRLTAGSQAVRAETAVNSDSDVDADGLTILTPPDPDIAGVAATTAPGPDHSAHVTLVNSVIRGAGMPLTASAAGGGLATVSAAFSDLPAGGSIALGNAKIEQSQITNVGDAGFSEAPGHEFELLPGSPLIDIGAPDAPQGTDLGGHARVADGNGDGVARRDIGAFELQPAPTPAPGPNGGGADTVAPVISGFRARRSRVSYKLSESGRVIVKVQKRLAGRRARYRTLGRVAKPAKQGANRLKLSRRIRARDIRPGRYRAVIVAVDAAGNRSARRTAAFRVRAS